MNKVTCLSGVSCGGKTAVLVDLDNSASPKGQHITVMVSDVTRQLRSADEHFRNHISREEHALNTAQGAYIQTIEYNGEFSSVKRTDVDEALHANKYVLVDCVPDGVRQFSRHHPTSALFIYAWPRELYMRHLKRGTPVQEMKWRLSNAEKELKAAMDSGLYSLYINNTDLEETKRKVVTFLDGEHVDSEPVELEAFSAELRKILTELG